MMSPSTIAVFVALSLTMVVGLLVTAKEIWAFLAALLFQHIQIDVLVETRGPPIVIGCIILLTSAACIDILKKK